MTAFGLKIIGPLHNEAADGRLEAKMTPVVHPEQTATLHKLVRTKNGWVAAEALVLKGPLVTANARPGRLGAKIDTADPIQLMHDLVDPESDVFTKATDAQIVEAMVAAANASGLSNDEARLLSRYVAAVVSIRCGLGGPHWNRPTVA